LKYQSYKYKINITLSTVQFSSVASPLLKFAAHAMCHSVLCRALAFFTSTDWLF